jgi:hypothetical protein
VADNAGGAARVAVDHAEFEPRAAVVTRARWRKRESMSASPSSITTSEFACRHEETAAALAERVGHVLVATVSSSSEIFPKNTPASHFHAAGSMFADVEEFVRFHGSTIAKGS